VFITIEGIEGGGKTTQVGLLAAALERAGRRVLVTREPGGTPLGAELRTLLLHETFSLSPRAELFLLLADRAEHVERTIRPALARGEIVLCDRFSDSTLAYQAYGRELPLDEVAATETIARGGLTPDLTFLLDCPTEVGLGRTHARRGAASADRFESEEVAFHERVRAGFLALARAEAGRIHRLDASRPQAAVHAEILALTERRLAESAK
jgi:dTMP kinase